MAVYVRNLVINTDEDFSENFELSELTGTPTNLTGFAGTTTRVVEGTALVKKSVTR